MRRPDGCTCERLGSKDGSHLPGCPVVPMVKPSGAIQQTEGDYFVLLQRMVAQARSRPPDPTLAVAVSIGALERLLTDAAVGRAVRSLEDAYPDHLWTVAVAADATATGIGGTLREAIASLDAVTEAPTLEAAIAAATRSDPT